MDERTDPLAVRREWEQGRTFRRDAWQLISRMDWMTAIPVVGVGAAAAVASFDSLRKFAVAVGWPDETAWLLPLCLDLYAVMALRLWLRQTIDDKTRRWAAGSGWLAVALSIGGNAVQHAISLGRWVDGQNRPHLAIVVIVAAVPPVMLALLIHLESMRRASQTGTDAAAPSIGAEGDLQRDLGDGDLTTSREEPASPPQVRTPRTQRRSRQPGGAGQRTQVIALLVERPDAETASAYELGSELAAVVGGHPQTIRRYVRDWQRDRARSKPVLVHLPAVEEAGA